ncbi:MAG: InlB B-repeat-containing protein [Firmicutes bacterium]|nr:InlB B-repeat-containing protein [Bacillota bacterium]
MKNLKRAAIFIFLISVLALGFLMLPVKETKEAYAAGESLTLSTYSFDNVPATVDSKGTPSSYTFTATTNPSNLTVTASSDSIWIEVGQLQPKYFNVQVYNNVIFSRRKGTITVTAKNSSNVIVATAKINVTQDIDTQSRNCYGWVFEPESEHYFKAISPGYISDYAHNPSSGNTTEWAEAIKSDFEAVGRKATSISGPTSSIGPNEYRIAFRLGVLVPVSSISKRPAYRDYHFMKQLSNGRWSEVMGAGASVRNFPSGVSPSDMNNGQKWMSESGTVVYDGTILYFAVEKSSQWNAPAGGGSKSFSVGSNATATSNSAWLRVSLSSGQSSGSGMMALSAGTEIGTLAAGDKTLTVYASANTTGYERYGKITITEGGVSWPFDVYQPGEICLLDMGRGGTYYWYPEYSSGETLTLTVSTSFADDWWCMVEDSYYTNVVSSWVKFAYGGSDQIKFTITETNNGSNVRTGNIGIIAQSERGDIARGVLVISQSPQTYTVSYDANGGTGTPGVQTKTYNETLKLSNIIPTREGYDFVGWATSSSGSVQYQPGENFYTNADTTLYAKWKIKTYNITYDLNGGDETDPNNFLNPGIKTHGYSFSILAVAYRPGYRILGWSTDKYATVPEYQVMDNFSINADTVLYAVWQKYYRVTYDMNGGVGTPSGMINHGWDHDAVLVLSNFVPTKTEHIFLGWSEDINATVAEYQPEESMFRNADLDLYAVWIKYYTIRYSGVNDTPENQTKLHDVPITLSKLIPEREGYAFLGWSTSGTTANTVYQSGGSFNLNANTYLYPVWSATLLPVGDGFRSEDELFDFTVLPNFEVAIGAVDIWSLCGELVIPEYVAGPDGNIYTVTAIREYGFLNAMGLTGDLVIPNGIRNIGDSAFYNCYGLDGVLVIPESVISIGLSAFEYCNFWTIIASYNITYDANGGSNAPEKQTKQYDEPLRLRSEILVRDGYLFLGWSGSSTATFAAYQAGGIYAANAHATLYAVWKATSLLVGDTFQSEDGLFEFTILPNFEVSIKALDVWSLYGELIIPEFVTGPDGHVYCVTAIKENGFSYAMYLMGDLIIPNSIRTIGNGAFYYCLGFSGTLVIPESVITIGEYAFEGCNFYEMHFYMTDLDGVDSDAFYGLNYIPVYCLQGYEELFINFGFYYVYVIED